MLAVDHFHRQGLMHQHQTAEDTQFDGSHSYFAMDSFAVFNTMPFAFYGGPAFFTEMPEDIKYDMSRSYSQASASQPECRNADMPPALLSGSAPSVPSASSSRVGSPYSGHIHEVPRQDVYPMLAAPYICDETFSHDFTNTRFDAEAVFVHEGKLAGSFADPVLFPGPRDTFLNTDSYQSYPPASQTHHYSPAPSPAPSSHSYHSFGQPVTVDHFGIESHHGRRLSVSSQRSPGSPQTSLSGDEDSKERTKCPYPDCGRVFKDLKAHMLTHGSERPEKCPIVNCEYNKKGFARKYDKNRHTLTHYKGTMVCGFCPGSGSAAEKSFNRADVFKRHLTSVHKVEQTPPNSRKRSPSKANIGLSSYCQDATGKCSTCSATFTNAQDFYEHLDDCVLRVVQQEDPREVINAQRLAEVADDNDVHATFERNHIKEEESVADFDEDEVEEDDEDDEDDEPSFHERFGKGGIRITSKPSSNRPIIGGNISKRPTKKGLTWSKGGASIIGKGRKRRKHYPSSWGMSIDKLNMRKRVICTFDGQQRLLKDDMMMHGEFEVRMPLQGGGYVTDLDIETMKRVEAFHNAVPEEKIPWIPEQDFLQEFMS